MAEQQQHCKERQRAALEQAMGQEIAGERADEEKRMGQKISGKINVPRIGQSPKALESDQPNLERRTVISVITLGQKAHVLAKRIADGELPEALHPRLIEPKAVIAGCREAEGEDPGEHTERTRMPH